MMTEKSHQFFVNNILNDEEYKNKKIQTKVKKKKKKEKKEKGKWRKWKQNYTNKKNKVNMTRLRKQNSRVQVKLKITVKRV